MKIAIEPSIKKIRISALTGLTVILTCTFSLFTLPFSQADMHGNSARGIKLGILIPLSGSLAEYGVALKNAMMLAQERKPEPFQHVELIFEDYMSDPKAAVSAFQKLSSVDGVDAVYIWGATPTEAIAPLAEEKKIPLIALSLNDASAVGRPHVIRTIPTSDNFVAPLAQHIQDLHAKKKLNSLLILKTEWVYTETLARALRAQLPESLPVQEISFERAESDFKSAISKVKGSHANGIAVLLGTGQIRTFFRQLGNLSSQYTIFGDDFFGSSEEIEASGPGIQGAVFQHISSCREFEDAYKKRFGSLTHVYHAVNAFDMLSLLAESGAASTDKESLLTHLRAVSEYRGVCDSFSFVSSPDQGQYFSYPVKLYKVDGKYPSVYLN